MDLIVTLYVLVIAIRGMHYDQHPNKILSVRQFWFSWSQLSTVTPNIIIRMPHLDSSDILADQFCCSWRYIKHLQKADRSGSRGISRKATSWVADPQIKQLKIFRVGMGMNNLVT